MWVSVKDAAAIKGVSVQAIYQAIRRKRLEARLAKGAGRAIEVKINTKEAGND